MTVGSLLKIFEFFNVLLIIMVGALIGKWILEIDSSGTILVACIFGLLILSCWPKSSNNKKG